MAEKYEGGKDVLEKQKKIQLNYEVTHRKLLSAINEMIACDKEISCKEASRLAGVSVSTAYKHGCPELIRRALGGQKIC